MKAGVFVADADDWFDEAGDEMDSLVARKVITFRDESGKIGFFLKDNRALRIARGILAGAWRWSDELGIGESFNSRAKEILVPDSGKVEFFSMHGSNWLFFHDPKDDLLKILQGKNKNKAGTYNKEELISILEAISKMDKAIIYENMPKLLVKCDFISRWTGEYIFLFLKDYSAFEAYLRKLCADVGVELNIVVAGESVLPAW